MRGSVTRQLARLYIDSHVRDLADRPGVLCIHAEQGADTVQQSLHAHAVARLERYYPETEYPTEGGGVIPEIRAMVEEQATRKADRAPESGFEMKQTTMPDATQSVEYLFENVRRNVDHVNS